MTIIAAAFGSVTKTIEYQLNNDKFKEELKLSSLASCWDMQRLVNNRQNILECILPQNV